MDNEIIEAMNDYYKLKQQYDNTVISQKNKILKNDTLSLNLLKMTFCH